MNDLTIEKRQFHNFDTATNGLINFGHLVIPAYQRRYAWREDNIDMVKDELMDKAEDIKARFTNFKKKNGNLENILKPYADKLIGQRIYFGNIVITLNKIDSSPDSVVDGQQRLSTFTLFLKYFQLIEEELKTSNLYKENSKAFTPLLGKIETVLYYKTQDGDKMNFISSENEYDKEYLDEIFNITTIDDISSKRKNTYLSNLSLIKNKMDNLDSNTKLLILLALMTSELGITSVVGEERAYELFEALNSRSLQLSPSDLIKNHLFKLTINEADFDPKEKWEEFVGNLSIKQSGVKASVITSFIRAYIVQDERRYIKKKDLFKAFKNAVSVKNIVTYFDGMIAAANVYTKATTGTFLHNNEINIDLKKSFISVLPKIYTPILIYGELNFDMKTNFTIQEYLFKQSILHFAINNLPSKELDKNIIKVLNEITVDSGVDIIKKSFDKHLKSETINLNDTYEKRVDRLLNKKFDDRKVLLALYKYLYSVEDAEFYTVFKDGELDLEHILPQTPSKWVGKGKEFATKEEAEECIGLIGNTLFIRGKINKKVSNKEYKYKLNNSEFSEYRDSDAKTIGESLNDSSLFKREMKDAFQEVPKNWTKEKIDKRTKYFVDKIREKEILLPK